MCERRSLGPPRPRAAHPGSSRPSEQGDPHRHNSWRLPRRDPEGDGSAGRVGDHYGLGAPSRRESAQSAGHPVRRFRQVPLFLDAPAALVCALTFVPSRKAIPSSTPRHAGYRAGGPTRKPRPTDEDLHGGSPPRPQLLGHKARPCVAPFVQRQRMASMVRRRSWWSVLYGGRHAAISGASTSHCACRQNLQPVSICHPQQMEQYSGTDRP